MSLHDTCRTNFVLSEILIWTKYLLFALQKMYEVSGEIDDEKEAVKEDLAVAEEKKRDDTPPSPSIALRIRFTSYVYGII